ncbi:histidine kinase [Actinotalea sp. C106]|uniref:sensor histidine kinase n=1 Tax=Actinotalea sp. C106 TaxID=2908644 RepID=UPI0020294DDE|nr:histidine kinase [Actinotalea sp. C106]
MAPTIHAVVVGGLLWITSPGYVLPVSPEGYAGQLPGAAALVGVAGVASVGGILLARWRPWWAALLPLAPFLLLPWTGWFVWGWFAALVSIASIAALDGLRRALVPTVAAVGVALVYSTSTVHALLPIGPVTSGRQTPAGASATSWLGLDSRVGPVLVAYVVAILAVVGVSWAVGGARRAREARAAAERSEHRAMTVESTAAERARLARDLHDVVAHHVSLVAVRAESAPFQHPTLDPEARTVLAAIAQDARAALGELRQVLTVLQRAEGAAAERAPQPGVTELGALVSDARSAGQVVEVVGAAGDVPAAPGYVLYRAVQEGLSNARRHAPEASVRLEWRRPDGRVGLTMTNLSGQDGPPGRGLLGMRERVEALGGTLHAGRSNGTFVLEVELPVDES